ncbi:MAG: imidazole glycerol phosphate synthase subunit HisH [Acidobacteria bacterium]|nr:MAG: imidazole glycerol phosphate synthase subunit HisH [Acidobacteriota bacterium]
MIALIDYGAGNLTSVRKGLAAAGAEFFTPETPRDLGRATAVVIPGVGNFGATAALDDGWRQAILDGVASGRPLLGICLGLQYLFDGSEEAPGVRGLGLLRGRCTRLPATVKVPHVGWNSLTITRRANLTAGIEEGTQAYFTHSYAAPVTSACVAETSHGTTFASIVEDGAVSGVQFHPEKSGTAGIALLRNFVASCSRNA